MIHRESEKLKVPSQDFSLCRSMLDKGKDGVAIVNLSLCLLSVLDITIVLLCISQFCDHSCVQGYSW